MKKISPMAELRMVDTIRAARESSGRGTDPSEAVAKLAMEQNMSTEEASRICEAVNKLASIDYLSTHQDARAGEFPLADSAAVRKIMRDSLKIAKEPFKFRRTINDDLPLPKMSDKQAFEKVFKPTEEEQKYLDSRTTRMQAIADWEKMQHLTEAAKKACEYEGVCRQMFCEEFIKFGNKVASMDDRSVDNMARYAVYTYGNDGVNFLTALENLTGRTIDKERRPYMKTGSEAENGVDRLMYMADSAKAIKVADATLGGVTYTFDSSAPEDMTVTSGVDVPYIKKQIADADTINKANAINAVEAANKSNPASYYLTGAGEHLNKTLANRIKAKNQYNDAVFEDEQKPVVQETQDNNNQYSLVDSENRLKQQPITIQTTNINNNTANRRARFENQQLNTVQDTQATRNRTDNEKARFEEGQLPIVQKTQETNNRVAKSDSEQKEKLQPTRQETEEIETNLKNAETKDKEAARAAIEDARAQGELDDAETDAKRAESTRQNEAEVKYRRTLGERRFEEEMERRGLTPEERMRRQYERSEADRAWMERDRQNKARAEAWRKTLEQGDKTSKALQEMASNALSNTRNALTFGTSMLQKADAIRQALTPEQRSGNAATRPLSNFATKYIENLRLHDVFAKTYLSDPYLHQYSPQEVAEAFNIVYEVAPELVKHGSNPHIIGALIRKYLANTNQLDPLEIRDLTSTEKDRVDTMLKQEQLEAIKRGK